MRAEAEIPQSGSNKNVALEAMKTSQKVTKAGKTVPYMLELIGIALEMLPT